MRAMGKANKKSNKQKGKGIGSKRTHKERDERKNAAMKFVDDQADEDDDEEDGVRGAGGREDAYYNPE